MTASEQTPDLMLEALEKAGYSLENDVNINAWVVFTPDGWSCSRVYHEGVRHDKEFTKHGVIQQAYTHMMQAQELDRLRAKVAELEAFKSFVKSIADDYENGTHYDNYLGETAYRLIKGGE